jgi:hypothetical protein
MDLQVESVQRLCRVILFDFKTFDLKNHRLLFAKLHIHITRLFWLLAGLQIFLRVENNE